MLALYRNERYSHQFNIFTATLTNKLSYQEQQIQPLKNPVSNFVNADNIFNSVYTITSVLSFLSIWGQLTIFLMHHYSKKLERQNNWIFIVFPLVYFLSQFQGIFIDSFCFISAFFSPVLFGIVYTLVFECSQTNRWSSHWYRILECR